VEFEKKSLLLVVARYYSVIEQTVILCIQRLTTLDMVEYLQIESVNMDHFDLMSKSFAELCQYDFNGLMLVI